MGQEWTWTGSGSGPELDNYTLCLPAYKCLTYLHLQQPHSAVAAEKYQKHCYISIHSLSLFITISSPE